MLRELRIRDFAIIDDLTIRFEPGLNVITGETGSGKSILIGALSLLCGGRAGSEVVRGRAEEASIEALFDHPAPGTALEGLGVGPDDELLIRRVIPQSGKGRVYVNGSPATVGLLARLGAQLVHVYGQHEQALLLDPRSHLEFLDQYGGLMPLRREMAEAFAALAAARTELEQSIQRRRAQEERRDLLEFQVQELAGAGISADEEERLRRERDILRHAERLQQVCRSAEASLYGEQTSIVSALARLRSQLRDLVRIDAALAEPAELIDSASAQIEEAALGLRRYADRVQYDPERQAAIEDRLALLVRLAKKYRATPGELPAILAALQQELAHLETVGAECAAAQARVDVLAEQGLSVALKLSRARCDAARKLEAAMAGELAALGMRGAAFSVTHGEPEAGATAGDLDATGYDRIEFFLAANPGEPARPLAQVASGGELSRIMLALKTLTATVTETPIIIFDEVDAGIGGAVADSVARRLAALAKNHQLLCITHLPQIAAYADHHLAVHKEARRERTIARVQVLAEEERVMEITRMLGGAVAPAEAKRYAERLLAQACGAAPHPRRSAVRSQRG